MILFLGSTPSLEDDVGEVEGRKRARRTRRGKMRMKTTLLRATRHPNPC